MCVLKQPEKMKQSRKLSALVRVSTMIKHHDPKHLGEMTGFFHLRVCSPSFREVRAGNCRQELMQKPCRTAANLMTPHGFLSQLSYTI